MVVQVQPASVLRTLQEVVMENQTFRVFIGFFALNVVLFGLLASINF